MNVTQEIRKPLLILLLVLAGFFVYTKLAGPIPFSVNSVQTTKDNLFSTSGTGEATAIPNTAQISIGVTQTATTLSDAQSKLNANSKKLINSLKELGVDEKDIKTINYSISPNYDFAAGQKITGYTATQNLEIKTQKAELSNKIIDTATANGANLVGGVSFTFDEKTKKELENQARIEAVNEAKAKAESLAKAAGIRLGKVIDIQESTNPNGPIPLGIEYKNTAGDSATNITAGENSIEITVTISYETL